MFEINTITNIDCLEGLKQLSNKSIEKAFTDPPYNVGKDYGTYKDNRDDYLDWMKEIVEELERITTKGYIFFIGHNILKDLWNIIPNARLIIVHRRAIGAFDKNYFRMYRAILTTINPIKRTYDLWNDVRLVTEGFYCREPHYKHPARTSNDLTTKVIKTFTLENETILDPFMGTGTTAVCCKQNRRNFIGFELNPDYYKIAQQRLNETKLITKMEEWFK